MPPSQQSDIQRQRQYLASESGVKHRWDSLVCPSPLLMPEDRGQAQAAVNCLSVGLLRSRGLFQEASFHMLRFTEILNF